MLIVHTAQLRIISSTLKQTTERPSILYSMAIDNMGKYLSDNDKPLNSVDRTIFAEMTFQLSISTLDFPLKITQYINIILYYQ